MKRSFSFLLLISSMLLIASASGRAQDYRYPEHFLKGKKYTKVSELKPFEETAAAIKEYISPLADIEVPIKIERVYTFSKSDSIYICVNSLLADYPIRPSTASDLVRIAQNNLPEKYMGKRVAIFVNGQRLKDLITPFFDPENKYFKIEERALKEQRSGGIKAAGNEGDRIPPLKEEISKPYKITAGLQGRHIAMSNSHGWFYEPTLDRWEFQRARLFGVVEDTYTMSYVVPFLTPMLEKAGAVVMMPKERDWNVNEVIVDNDTNKEGYYQIDGAIPWVVGDSLGFANPKATYVYGENPFKMGTYVQTEGLLKKTSSVADEERLESTEAPSTIVYIPNIPESGDYAVYISYHSLPNSTNRAHYTVKYCGGEAQFNVNQQMGGGIWVYLGTFYFKKGVKNQGVYLTNANTIGTVTADACKFGGGMGNIARGEGEGFVSGMPRFMEGARYWLQWSGMPDTVYSFTNNLNDYDDDYVSRGKWVNRLAGGSSVLPDWGYGGERIPIDLSFSFHTDAGTFPGDTIVGTLAIYTRTCPDFGGANLYPDGRNRILGRYLADIVQTQAVNDVSKKYGFKWTRRGLWDRSYSESRTPQVPGMLLEFLSHHNFADMKFGLDPDFRFTVARAVYKGILKFLAMENNVPYVVAPLPVNNMMVTLEGASDPSKEPYACVTWSAVEDESEPSAIPQAYIVYTAEDDGGYNGGVRVKKPSYRVKLQPGHLYKFKVTAVNDGGESFPSEIVAAGVPETSKARSGKDNVVLVVNAFDRVGAPMWLQSRDSTIAGFFTNYDHGVPYIKDASYLGQMYEYRREVPWTDDDAPGFGACYSDMAGKIIAGNTFDYSYDHGLAFIEQGYAFASATRSAVENGKIKLSDYPICDIIMGKQAQSNDGALTQLVKYEAYTPAMREAIARFCGGGRKLLISGAYVATDLVDAYNVDSTGAAFASDVLKIKWMTHSAATDGRVAAVGNKFGFSGSYEFYSYLNDKKYVCEAPDAFTPACDGAYTIFRYPQTSISAAVAYKGEEYDIAVFGFPIETLKTQEQINSLIGEVINFFEDEVPE